MVRSWALACFTINEGIATTFMKASLSNIYFLSFLHLPCVQYGLDAVTVHAFCQVPFLWLGSTMPRCIPYRCVSICLRLSLTSGRRGYTGLVLLWLSRFSPAGPPIRQVSLAWIFSTQRPCMPSWWHCRKKSFLAGPPSPSVFWPAARGRWLWRPHLAWASLLMAGRRITAHAEGDKPWNAVCV